MTKYRRKRAPTLTLVAGAGDRSQDTSSGREAAERRPLVRDRDWSVLMARAQDGDRASYRQLLEAITPYVRTLAARRHLDPGDVEDAMQDVLLTVHEIRRTYDPRRPFGPWLVTIANRRIVDRLRRVGRTRSRETVLSPQDETFADPRANLPDESSDRRVLRQAIEDLSPGQRSAIRMLKLEEKSLKEAAAQSGMSVAALKVATHRALKALRAILSVRGET